jgi:hypothetical protein
MTVTGIPDPQTPIPSSTLIEYGRLYDFPHIEAEHTHLILALLTAMQALEQGLAAGVPPTSGATLAAYAARMTAIETTMATLTGTPVPGPVGPTGPQGTPGLPGVSWHVITAAAPPTSPNQGDVWIDDTTQKAYFWSGLAWNPMVGGDGQPGPPGVDGATIDTVTVHRLRNSDTPTAVWDKPAKHLTLGIPEGDPGKPLRFAGQVGTIADLPDPALNEQVLYTVSSTASLYWSNGVNWIYASPVPSGPTGARGPAGPTPTIVPRIGALTWSQPPTVAITATGQPDEYWMTFAIPSGKPGDKGDPGETLKPQGVVIAPAALPATPPRLTVLLTQSDASIWIYDPGSPAASNGQTATGEPAGWVSMGNVKGEKGDAGRSPMTYYQTDAPHGVRNDHWILL